MTARTFETLETGTTLRGACLDEAVAIALSKDIQEEKSASKRMARLMVGSKHQMASRQMERTPAAWGMGPFVTLIHLQ